MQGLGPGPGQPCMGCHRLAERTLAECLKVSLAESDLNFSVICRLPVNLSISGILAWPQGP